MTPGEPADDRTADTGTPAALVVDGNNVMGATADGWWRDRAGAGRRLVDRVTRYAVATGRPVTVVFDQPVAPAGAGTPSHEGPVTVLTARRRGRDAADDRIVELVATLATPVEVVTSDRGLADRLPPGVGVTGAGTFLRRLAAHDR